MILKPIQKVAVFILMLGFERGAAVIAQMDSREINRVVAEIGKMNEISVATQQIVLEEFKQLGYQDDMNAMQTLDIIRFLFNGSQIH
ncbi:MAG: hypothetical protein H6Q75_1171 [Firmicutes bacterium]|nr:hypothetical protein [Bacillota bacterium]